MVWVGVTSELIIWPCVLYVSVTGKSYPELLSHWLLLKFDNVGLLDSVTLLSYGVPAHYVIDVQVCLNIQFSLGVRQHGPLIWPPRGLCLSVYDNQLWVFCKRTAEHNLEALCCMVRVWGLSYLQYHYTSNAVMGPSQHIWWQIQLCVDNDGNHTNQLDIRMLHGEWCDIC
jgi:hypothetical protein